MAQRRPAAVLGLGRFGAAVAIELTRLGYEVLGIDNDEKVVQELSDDITQAIQADITDFEVLQELGLASFDLVVVAASESLETSILATVTAKRLGVGRVIAKAATMLHGSIPEQVGASLVVYPERETGLRLAHSIAAPGVKDYLDVAPGYGIARISISDEMLNKSLSTLDLGRSCGVTAIALHRGGSVTLNPDGSEVLRAGDDLVVAGLDENLARLPGHKTKTIAFAASQD